MSEMLAKAAKKLERAERGALHLLHRESWPSKEGLDVVLLSLRLYYKGEFYMCVATFEDEDAGRWVLFGRGEWATTALHEVGRKLDLDPVPYKVDEYHS